jgi:hypothetical protein
MLPEIARRLADEVVICAEFMVLSIEVAKEINHMLNKATITAH